MLKKSYLNISIIFFVGFFFFLFCIPSARSGNIDLNAIFKLTLNSSFHRSNIFEPIQFTHGLHFTKYKCKCNECHHNWIKEDEGYPARCSDCHKDRKLKGVLYTRALKDAYHASCMGCHNDRNEADKTTAPVECMQCHVYRNKKHQKAKSDH